MQTATDKQDLILPQPPLDDEEDDADDNIPLNQLTRIMGTTSMPEFIDINSHLHATEEPSEDWKSGWKLAQRK